MQVALGPGGRRDRHVHAGRTAADNSNVDTPRPVLPGAAGDVGGRREGRSPDEAGSGRDGDHRDHEQGRRAAERRRRLLRVGSRGQAGGPRPQEVAGGRARRGRAVVLAQPPHDGPNQLLVFAVDALGRLGRARRTTRSTSIIDVDNNGSEGASSSGQSRSCCQTGTSNGRLATAVLSTRSTGFFARLLRHRQDGLGHR